MKEEKFWLFLRGIVTGLGSVDWAMSESSSFFLFFTDGGSATNCKEVCSRMCPRILPSVERIITRQWKQVVLTVCDILL
jgi:hypothetical protein